MSWRLSLSGDCWGQRKLEPYQHSVPPLFTGTDWLTGRFATTGKPIWFKFYVEAGDNIIKASSTISDDTDVTKSSLMPTFTRLVCLAYCPNGVQILIIPELQSHLSCKYMAQREKLPPTIFTLRQHSHSKDPSAGQGYLGAEKEFRYSIWKTTFIVSLKIQEKNNNVFSHTIAVHLLVTW